MRNCQHTNFRRALYLFNFRFPSHLCRFYLFQRFQSCLMLYRRRGRSENDIRRITRSAHFSAFRLKSVLCRQNVAYIPQPASRQRHNGSSICGWNAIALTPFSDCACSVEAQPIYAIDRYTNYVKTLSAENHSNQSFFFTPLLSFGARCQKSRKPRILSSSHLLTISGGEECLFAEIFTQVRTNKISADKMRAIWK